jgi:hypothetical protein
MRFFLKKYSPWTARAWIALLLAMGMSLYVHQVLRPYERERYAALGLPENIGDLYPRWYGTRELLLRGRDPYSAAVSGEIQRAYYGHALDSNDSKDRARDEQRFAYPLYTALLMAPTAWMSFETTQTIARWVLACATILSIFLWLHALRWRPGYATLLTVVILTLSSPPLVQGLGLQQLGLLVGFFLAASAALLASGNLLLAGCFLAFATIKPQLALLPVLWLLLWAAGAWRARRRLVWGFGGTMALLIGAAQVLSPGWVPRFVGGLFAYTRYAGMSSLLDFYLSPTIAKPIGLIALIALGVACFRRRHEPADSEDFFLRFSLVLAVAILVLPPLLPPFNQVLLLPGLLAVLRSWDALWKSSRGIQAVCALGAAVVFWPWLAAPILVLRHAVGQGTPLSTIWLAPLAMSFAIPPLLLILLLRLFKIPARESA